MIDFKEMPKDRTTSYNNIIVTIDYFSKSSYYIPTTTKVTAREVAFLYYQRLYRYFGLPESITSNKGPQFVANFTNEISAILRVDWKLSSSRYS